MDSTEDDAEEERDGEWDQCKQEQVEDTGEEKNSGQESLIVPRPKMNAFQSIKEQGANQQDEGVSCRLVGKVNPNILKTWEQLFGGTSNACAHQRRPDRARGNGDGEDSITITATTNKTATTTTSTSGGSLALSSTIVSEGGSEMDDRQSCLLYCPQQQPYPYTLGDELFEFKVNRLEHPPDQSTSSRRAPSHVSSSTTCTTATARNSSDGVDFYDSIDAASTCLVPAADTVKDQEEKGTVGSYNDSAGGEALAELTSLDRKRLLWSIAIE